jgi:di-N-acetylchitobiase
LHTFADSVDVVLLMAFDTKRDFGWKPNVDGRYYPYKRLADIVDFVFLMVYDTRSQIIREPPCYAGPNAPSSSFSDSLSFYGENRHPARTNSLLIPNKKILIGVPWYGYIYQCLSFNPTHKACVIPAVPFRGAPCSDAAGREIDYPVILSALEKANVEGSLESMSLSMVAFVTKNITRTKKFSLDSIIEGHDVVTSVTTAYYYDSPLTIEMKLGRIWLMADSQLGGVGMWNADVPDYKNNPLQGQQFWAAMTKHLDARVGDAIS